MTKQQHGRFGGRFGDRKTDAQNDDAQDDIATKTIKDAHGLEVEVPCRSRHWRCAPERQASERALHRQIRCARQRDLGNPGRQERREGRGRREIRGVVAPKFTKTQQISGLRKALKNPRTPKQLRPSMKTRLAKLTRGR
jgi:hypothetical protein